MQNDINMAYVMFSEPKTGGINLAKLLAKNGVTVYNLSGGDNNDN